MTQAESALQAAVTKLPKDQKAPDEITTCCSSPREMSKWRQQRWHHRGSPKKSTRIGVNQSRWSPSLLFVTLLNHFYWELFSDVASLHWLVDPGELLDLLSYAMCIEMQVLPRQLPQELGYPQLDPKFQDKEPETQLAQRPKDFCYVAARADDLVSLDVAEVAKKTTSVGQAKPVRHDIFQVILCSTGMSSQYFCAG